MGRPRLYNREYEKRQCALEGFDKACSAQADRIRASFFMPGKDTPDAEEVYARYRWMVLGPARMYREHFEQETRGRV